MTLVIILNAILSVAATVTMVAPVVWAIATQHRDQPAAIAMARRTSRASRDAARGRRRPIYEPTTWPAR